MVQQASSRVHGRHRFGHRVGCLHKILSTIEQGQGGAVVNVQRADLDFEDNQTLIQDETIVY